MMMHFNNTVLHCYCNVELLWYQYSCSLVVLLPPVNGKFIVGLVYLLTALWQSTTESGGITFIFSSGLFHVDRQIREPINQVTVALPVAR